MACYLLYTASIGRASTPRLLPAALSPWKIPAQLAQSLAAPRRLCHRRNDRLSFTPVSRPAHGDHRLARPAHRSGYRARRLVAAGSERIAYAGLQIAFAFYLSLFQGFAPATDFDVIRDRLVGIVLGIVVLSLVFHYLWPERPESDCAKRWLGRYATSPRCLRFRCSERHGRRRQPKPRACVIRSRRTSIKPCISPRWPLLKKTNPGRRTGYLCMLWKPCSAGPKASS